MTGDLPSAPPRPIMGLGEALLVRIEGTLWEPGQLWADAVVRLASRFERMRPLDVAAIPPAGDAAGLAAAVEAVAAWAGTDIGWERELARFFDEHLSLHVRPDPALSRTVRELGKRRPLLAVSALPAAVVSSILAHGGTVRAFAGVIGGTTSDRAALESARATRAEPINDAVVTSHSELATVAASR